MLSVWIKLLFNQKLQDIEEMPTPTPPASPKHYDDLLTCQRHTPARCSTHKQTSNQSVQKRSGTASDHHLVVPGQNCISCLGDQSSVGRTSIDQDIPPPTYVLPHPQYTSFSKVNFYFSPQVMYKGLVWKSVYSWG